MTAAAFGAHLPADREMAQDPFVNAALVDVGNEDADGPTYRATRYVVYPTGFSRVEVPDRRHWCLRVEDAGDGWAVRWRSSCLNFRNQWEFEPPPRSRTADFLARCRFSERAAILRAKRVVDALVVEDETYHEFVERIRREAAARARAALEAGTSASPLDIDPDGPVLPLHHRFRRALSLARPGTPNKATPLQIFQSDGTGA